MRLRERESELRGESDGVVVALGRVVRVVAVERFVDEEVLEELVLLCELEEENVGVGPLCEVDDGMVNARRTRRKTFVDWDMLAEVVGYSVIVAIFVAFEKSELSGN